MLIQQTPQNFTNVKVGDSVVVCYGTATLLGGIRKVVKVGRLNFTVDGNHTFRKSSGTRGIFWCVPAAAAKKILFAYISGERTPMPDAVTGLPHATLWEGQGSI